MTRVHFHHFPAGNGTWAIRRGGPVFLRLPQPGTMPLEPACGVPGRDLIIVADLDSVTCLLCRRTSRFRYYAALRERFGSGEGEL